MHAYEIYYLSVLNEAVGPKCILLSNSRWTLTFCRKFGFCIVECDQELMAGGFYMVIVTGMKTLTVG